MTKFTAVFVIGIRQYLRNSLFIILLIALPPTFISLSFVVTPDVPAAITVHEGNATLNLPLALPELHGSLMVPMTVSFLSGLLGLFVMLSAREGDRRLVIAGYSPTLLLMNRLFIVTLMALVVTSISVGVTFISFRPEQPLPFFWINLVSALQYGFLGAVAGTFLGAMSGTYLIFFAPMIDVGIIQNPMFPKDNIEWWAKVLPGYAPMEVLTDVSFTKIFDAGSFAIMAVAYAAAIALIAGLLFRRVTAVHV